MTKMSERTYDRKEISERFAVFDVMVGYDGEPRETMNLTEAGAILGCSARTVQEMIRMGILSEAEH